MLIFDLYFNKKISRLGDLFWYLVYCFWFIVLKEKWELRFHRLTLDY